MNVKGSEGWVNRCLVAQQQQRGIWQFFGSLDGLHTLSLSGPRSKMKAKTSGYGDRRTPEGSWGPWGVFEVFESWGLKKAATSVRTW